MSIDVKQIGEKVERESKVLEAVRGEIEKVIIGQGEMIERLRVV